MHPRRWKAFIRLNGETLVENDRDIMKEFTGFVAQLRQIGLDYSIVVSVDGKAVDQFGARTRELARTIANSASHGEELSSGRA